MNSTVVLDAGDTSHLELPWCAVAAGDRVVHEDARVAEQVHSLSRAPHHRKPQRTVHHERLHGAQPGTAVTPDRDDEHNARTGQQPTPELSEPRLLALDVRPAHNNSRYLPNT